MSDAQNADYERVALLLWKCLQYVEHHWSCKGEGPMKKGCTCGMAETEANADKEIERWQTEVCVHEPQDLDGGPWCPRCHSWLDKPTALIDGSVAMLEVTSEYLRDALEQIASALGLTIAADYGPKPNGVLLDDILRQIDAVAREGDVS